MNPRLLLKAGRNLRIATAARINRALGREYIPAHRDCLFIETSSICNLNCHFCAYPKKQSAKVTMDDAFFQDVIGQALAMGYRTFDLTPCTGDVFMDRGLLRKLSWLEAHPDVRGFSFHTNFTIPRRQDIDRLGRIEKFTDLHISVYGHDEASFVAMTQGPAKLYARLVANLEHLYALTRQRNLPVHFAFHTGARSLRGKRSALIDVIGRFERAGAPVAVQKRLYNNWGGFVTAQDVKHLPITVLDGDMIDKNGACVRLFTTIQVMATGIVNGCACRDADATLRLGDLKRAPLREVVSARNPEYMKLIDEQQRGEFRPVCRSCDFYSSIYHRSSQYRKEGAELQNLAQFKASLA